MGESILREILKLSSNFFNKIFGIMIGISSGLWLDYNSVVSMIEELNKKIYSVCKTDSVKILIISNNMLLKSIVFMYALFTQTKVYFISPKFEIGEIINSMLSLRNINLLIIDISTFTNIKKVEEEDNINVQQFFPHILYSYDLFEEIYTSYSEKKDNDSTYKRVRKLITMASVKSLVNKVREEYFTFLSPGTDQAPSFINIHAKTLFQTAMKIKQFFGFKANDTVMIVADFELYPTLYTILGFISGIKYINPMENIISVEEFKTDLKKHKILINNLLISSNQFTKIWDYIIEKVFSNKLYFRLNKCSLTTFIVNWRIQKEIRNTFPYIQKVHILNEHLGLFALKHLAKSKILFSSSYGFLEQGNFLAFKHPLLFRNKKFFMKAGGTILKSSPILGDEPFVDEESNVTLFAENNIAIIPGDIGIITDNIKEQGDRKYIVIYGRKNRNVNTDKTVPSVEQLERFLKDDVILKNCFIKVQKSPTDTIIYNFYFEIRENLLDLHKVSFHALETEVKSMIKVISEEINVETSGYAILPNFNSMENIAGRIKYYTT